MRISDWSSDVCSSDLLSRGWERRMAGRKLPPLTSLGLGNKCRDDSGVDCYSAAAVFPSSAARQVSTIRSTVCSGPRAAISRARAVAARCRRCFVNVMLGLAPYQPVVPALVAGTHRPARSIGLRERSEEHTSELQSLMRLSYAVSC